MTKRTIAAAVYLRASTDQQETSCEDQLKEVLKYAKQHGYSVQPGAVYQDEGVSGWKEHERAGFQRMIEDSASGSFETVLVWKQNRFSRFRPAKFFRYADQLLDNGVTITTLDKGMLNLDDIATAITGLVDARNDEAYSKNLAVDVHRGMSGRAELGDWVSGTPPYGYDLAPLLREGRKKPVQRLVVGDVAKVALIVRMFEMYDAGYSLRGVADQLNNEGILSPKGLPWRVSSVKCILVNAAYIGTYVWGQRSNSRFLDAESREINMIPDNHPAIVDKQLFARVQRKLKQRGKPHSRTPIQNGGQFVLTGLVRCGKCGAPMSARRSGGDQVRYSCSSSDTGGKSLCAGNAVNQAEVLEHVARAIETYFTSDDVRERLLDMLLEDMKGPNTADADVIQKQLDQCLSDIQRQNQKLVMCDGDPETFQLLQDDIRDKRAKRDRLQEMLKAAGTPREVLEQQAEEELQGILGAFDALPATLLSANWRELRELLRETVESIELWTDRRAEGRRVRYDLQRGVITLRTNLSSTDRRDVQVIRLEFVADCLDWIPAEQACAELGISRRTLQNWARQGRIKAMRKNGRTFVERASTRQS